MIRSVVTTLALFAVLLVGATSAWAHGSASRDYRSTVLSVTPEGLPVDVRVVGGDQLRFENQGDKELVVCGYEKSTCEEWVRIGPDGVYVDRDAKSYYANVDRTAYGEVPDDAGKHPNWQRVRARPPFYAYHDHRVHWMGLSLPPNVDPSDSTPQKVFDAEVAFRYGDTPGVVKTRLEYVGGAPWWRRHLEQLIVGLAVVGMLVVFGRDARRRRRLRAAGDDAPVDTGAGAADPE